MRFENTFQATTPIGQAISNLGAALFSGPSPVEQEQLALENAYRQAQTDYAQTQAAANRAKMDAAASLAGALEPFANGPLPEGVTDRGAYIRSAFPRVAGTLAQAGDISNIGQLFQAFVANTSGTSDNDVVRAMAGAGNTLGVNDAVSLPGQESVAARNALNASKLQAQQDAAATQRALDVLRATPLTKAQVEGQVLQNLIPTLTESQKLVVGGVQNPYNGQIITGADGNSYRIDQNDAFSIANPIPVRVPVDPGHGAHPTGPSVALAPLNVDTAPNDPASRRARDLQAASMGITLQELDFLERVDQTARNNLAGFDGLDKDTRDIYAKIMAKVRGNLGGYTPRPTTGAPLPQDYTVVQ